MADNDPLPFKLKSAIPKVDMRFPDDKDHKYKILGRQHRDAEVVWALCADMEERDKNLVQNLVSPVFHKAAMMIEGGALRALVGNRDVKKVDGAMIWARFLAQLQSESPKKWPGRLSIERFSQFISALAEARWWEIHQPKNDGRKHGLLVQHISMFLAAAEDARFPWAHGGHVFYNVDEDEEDHDYDLDGTGDYEMDLNEDDEVDVDEDDEVDQE